MEQSAGKSRFVCRQVFLAVIVFAISSVVHSAVGDAGAYLNRINYGVVFKPTSEHALQVATAKVVFVINLPPIAIVTRQNVSSDGFNAINSTLKPQIVGYINHLHELDFLALQTINIHLKQIREVVSNFATKSKRAWIDALGKVIATVTGLVHEDDLVDLKAIVTKMNSDTIEAIQTWSTATDNVITAVQMTNDRIDRLAAVANRTIRTQKMILRSLAGDHSIIRSMLNFMLAALKHSSLYTESLVDIVHLQSSLNQLLSGSLTHDLVPTDQLNNALSHLSNYLATSNSQLQILIDQHAYYYQSAVTSVCRHHNEIFIVLRVPLTANYLKGKFTLYHILTVPIAVPRDNQSTIIHVEPTAILYHPNHDVYLTYSSGSSLPSSPVIDLNDHIQNTIRKSRDSCLIALLEGDAHDVHNACKFSVTGSLPPPAFIRLSSDSIFLSNLDSITTTCNGVTASFRPPQIQLVYNLPCGCMMFAHHSIISRLEPDCVNRKGPNFTFPINLKLMYHFFGGSISDLSIQADTLTDNQLDLVVPKLLIDYTDLDDNVAMQSKPNFDLTSVINKSRADIKSYPSSNHLLLNRISVLEQSPHIAQIASMPYIVYASLIGSLLSLLAVLYLSRKVKLLTVLLSARAAAAVSLTSRNPVFPSALVYTVPGTSPIPSLSWYGDHETQSTRYFLSLIIVGIVIILILIVKLLHMTRSRRPHTHLNIVLINTDVTTHIRLPWHSLGYPAYFYNFSLDEPTGFAIATTDSRWPLRSYATVTCDNMHVGIKNMTSTIHLRSQITVTQSQLKIVNKIISGPFLAVLEVTNESHNVIETMPLNGTSQVLTVEGDDAPATSKARPAVVEMTTTRVYPSLSDENA